MLFGHSDLIRLDAPPALGAETNVVHRLGEHDGGPIRILLKP